MSTTTTIRMLRRKRVDGERSETRDLDLAAGNAHGAVLDGYIFTDMTHARTWLAQPFVAAMKISSLEVVEVGACQTCPRCKGTGSLQSVRILRKLSLVDFLADPITDRR